MEYVGAGCEDDAWRNRAALTIETDAAAPAIPYRVRWVAFGLLLVGLFVWEIAVRIGWISPLFFPPPSLIALTLGHMARTLPFWSALGITLARLIGGVALGASAGLLVGWAMGAIRPVRLTLAPVVAVLHPLPKLALFPLFLILLGIGEASKIALVALTAFFPMLINTLAGVEQIDRTYWEVAANYGAKGFALLRRVIVPGSLPLALVGLRLAINNALMITVAVEMLSAQQGLGVQIWLAWQTLRTEDLYVVLVTIALLGLVINWSLERLTRYWLPWQQENKN